MSKKDNDAKFTLNMNISLEGMTDVPEDKTASDIFMGFCIGMIQRWAEAKGGMSYQEHKVVGGIRQAFLDVTKVKETTIVLDRTQLKFLNKTLMEVTTMPFGGNEMMLRVGKEIENAFQNELT